MCQFRAMKSLRRVMLSQSSIDKDEILITYYLEGGRITGMVTDDTLWSFLYYGDTLIGFEIGSERY